MNCDRWQLNLSRLLLKPLMYLSPYTRGMTMNSTFLYCMGAPIPHILSNHFIYMLPLLLKCFTVDSDLQHLSFVLPLCCRCQIWWWMSDLLWWIYAQPWRICLNHSVWERKKSQRLLKCWKQNLTYGVVSKIKLKSHAKKNIDFVNLNVDFVKVL